MIGCIPPSAAALAMRRAYIDATGAENPANRDREGAGLGSSASPTRSLPLFGGFSREESAVISYLYHRKNTARWIPSLELAANTGIRERGVRYCIRALVIKGEPIATKSGPGGGFKFVEDAEELAASRDRLMKEARSIFYRLGRQQRSQILQELAGQERLSADSADSADCKSALPRAISQEEIR